MIYIGIVPEKKFNLWGERYSASEVRSAQLVCEDIDGMYTQLYLVVPGRSDRDLASVFTYSEMYSHRLVLTKAKWEVAQLK